MSVGSCVRNGMSVYVRAVCACVEGYHPSLVILECYQTDLDQGIIHTFAKAETGLGPSINLCWVGGGGEERREGGRDLVYGAGKTE